MQCLHTRGFLSPLHRSDHFKNHSVRLGILTEEEYEIFADEFLRSPCPTSALEFIRRWNGDLVRYDDVADVFAVLRKDRFIKTCYRPDPAFHGELTNLDYYFSETTKK
jgi:filamentous hemagglutinin